MATLQDLPGSLTGSATRFMTMGKALPRSVPYFPIAKWC